MSNSFCFHINLSWCHIGICSCIAGPRILRTSLTYLSFPGLQKPIYEFSCSCQIYFPLEESLPIQLVLLSRLAALHLILNQMDFTSLSAHKLFKQASHILQQEQRGTSPSCYNKAYFSHGHFGYILFLRTDVAYVDLHGMQCPFPPALSI